jgi:WG containing repeat
MCRTLLTPFQAHTKRWSILVLASCLNLSANSVERTPTKAKGAGPLFRIQYGGKWGFMDRTGKIVIKPQFEEVGDFFDGLARMEKGQQWGFINEKGLVVIPAQFEMVGDFSEGLAPVRVGRRWGYIDRTGKFVIEPEFQGAAEFRDGLGRVEIWDRIQCTRGTFTKDDAPLYVFTIYNFYGDCFPEHSRYGFVDRTGRLVVEPTFFFAEDFSDGLAAVRVEPSADSNFGFIDRMGKLAIQPRFDSVQAFSEGLAAVSIIHAGERGHEAIWGFIDKTGEFVIMPHFKYLRTFSEGLASAGTASDAWGFINKTGEFVIQPRFSQAVEFSDGLALVWLDDVEGGFYIDKTGNNAMNIKLWKQWPFSDGLTVAGESGKRVYVNKKGKVVAPYERERPLVK